MMKAKKPIEMEENKMKSNKFIGEGLKVEGPNLNVINVLRVLVEDKGSIVYIPHGYKKETSTSGDPKVHFNPVEAGKSIKVTDIQSNQERFNFSLTGLVDVMVEQEIASGEVCLVPKKIWRQYNIIRDGKLMMDYIVCKLSEEAFTNLRNAGILYYNGVAVPNNHIYVPDFLYKVVLKDIPLISLNWAQPVNIGLYDYMIEEQELMAKLKILRSLIKEYKADGQTLPEKNSDIYVEAYSGSEKVEPTGTAKCVVYSLVDVPEFDLSGYEERFPSLVYAEAEKKKLSDRLSDIRFISRCIILAIEESKKKGSYDWSELEKVPRSKNKMRQYATIDVDGKKIGLTRTVFEKSV